MLEVREHLRVPGRVLLLHARDHVGRVLAVEQRVLARELAVAAEARVPGDVDVGPVAREANELGLGLTDRAPPVDVAERALLVPEHAALEPPARAVERRAETHRPYERGRTHARGDARARDVRVGLVEPHVRRQPDAVDATRVAVARFPQLGLRRDRPHLLLERKAPEQVVEPRVDRERRVAVGQPDRRVVHAALIVGRGERRAKPKRREQHRRHGVQGRG